jgi:hypothetical protein
VFSHLETVVKATPPQTPKDTGSPSIAGLIGLAVGGINLHEITSYLLIAASCIRNRLVHMALRDLHALPSAVANFFRTKITPVLKGLYHRGSNVRG